MKFIKFAFALLHTLYFTPSLIFPIMSGWIEAPEEEEFHTLEEAEAYIYQHAFNKGYGLFRGDRRWDKKKPPQLRRWDFKCDKGGEVQGKGTERQTGSKKTDCDFEIRIYRKLTRGFEVKAYRPYHNHPASDDHRQHS